MLFIIISIILLSIILLLTIVISLKYFGLFDSIDIRCGRSPFDYNRRQIIYRIDYGQYEDSSTIFTELLSIFSNDIRKNLTTFGIYLDRKYFLDFLKDNNVKINTNELMNFDTFQSIFMVGALLNNDDNNSLNNELELQSELLKDKGYRYCELPAQANNVLSCIFPFRGILSVVIGSRRVYSSIEQYIQENKLIAYPKIEFYHNDHIYYVLPLENQHHFVELLSKKFVEQLKSAKDGESSTIEPDESLLPSADDDKIEEINDSTNDNGDDVEDQAANGSERGSERNSDSSYEMVD